MNFSAPDMIERIKSITPLKELENIGISAGTISAWKTNNRPPRSDDLYKISQYCGCTMEYLLTGNKIDDDYIFLSAKEQEILNNYKKLSDDQKKSIENIIEALAGKRLSL